MNTVNVAPATLNQIAEIQDAAKAFRAFIHDQRAEVLADIHNCKAKLERILALDEEEVSTVMINLSSWGFYAALQGNDQQRSFCMAMLHRLTEEMGRQVIEMVNTREQFEDGVRRLEALRIEEELQHEKNRAELRALLAQGV